MNDLLGLGDEIAARNSHSRRSTLVKTICVAVLAVAAIAAVAHGIFTMQQPATPQSNEPTQKPYQHAGLGNQCSEALNRYHDKVNAANKAVEDISNQSAATSQSITDQTQEYQASQDATYKEAYSDYTRLWESGQITTDDYLAKIKALQPVADNITDSAAINTQAQSALTNSTLIALQNAQNKALTLTQEQDRLQDCVNMTTAKEDIPASDTREFERLIAKSK